MSENKDEEIGSEVPRFLDDIEHVDRKRMKLDAFGRKRWSLTDKASNKEVLQEMGLGILDSDDMDSADSSVSPDSIKPSPTKRKHGNIENMSPNITSPSPSKRNKISPRSIQSPIGHKTNPKGSITSPKASLMSTRGQMNSPKGSITNPRSVLSPKSPDLSPKARRLQNWVLSSPGCSKNNPDCDEKSASYTKASTSSHKDLETTVYGQWSEDGDEETPLPLHPLSAEYAKGVSRLEHSPAYSSSLKSWPVSGSSNSSHYEDCTNTQQAPASSSKASQKKSTDFLIRRATSNSGQDVFSTLSDEVMLSIFRWLPKPTLVSCMLVCSRWHRIASDESFWQRLELGGRVLAVGALGRILNRKPIIIRLASSEIGEWNPTSITASRVQFLDLSMSMIPIQTLNNLLESCPALKKLSLESVPLSEDTCSIIGKCSRIETLNLTMASGLTSSGLISILKGCVNLLSLNVSWCQLCSPSLNYICNEAPTKLQRLNLAGAKLMTDGLVAKLVDRLPRLQELDLSDCSRLSGPSLLSISKLSRLEHLAISRCYQLPSQAITCVSQMPALQYLDIWGMLKESDLSDLRLALPAVQINQFMHSAIARPTVGTRRTSVWGLRTRD